jgi:hypothetical protein
VIAAVVTLAVLAVGAALTAAALGVRLSGVKGDMARAKLEAAAADRLAHDQEMAAKAALEETRQLRIRYGALEAQRRAELDEVHGIAARCADAGEIRRWLQRLTQEASRG